MDDNELTAEEQAALDAQRNTPEPEAPEQPAPEAPQEGAETPEAPEGAEEQPAADKRPQMVPHAALHEERKRRQEVERQAAEDRRRFEARVEKLLELVPQPAAQQPETPQAPAIPDVQADPVGHIVGTLQQLGVSQEQITQRVEQFRQQQEQQQLVASVIQRADAEERKYKAEHPEYDAAFAHLEKFHDNYLQASGWTDPVQRAQKLAADKFTVVVAALQQGANPAERLHRMAEAAGWRPFEPQPSEINDALRQTPAPPDPAARLRTVQQGQEHARTLGNVRGNGPSPMTAAKLLDMDDDAFLEAMKKSKDARKLMGA